MIAVVESLEICTVWLRCFLRFSALMLLFSIIYVFQEHYEIRLAELGTCICVLAIVLYSMVFSHFLSLRSKISYNLCVLVILSLCFNGHFPGEPGLAGVY